MIGQKIVYHFECDEPGCRFYETVDSPLAYGSVPPLRPALPPGWTEWREKVTSTDRNGWKWESYASRQRCPGCSIVEQQAAHPMGATNGRES